MSFIKRFLYTKELKVRTYCMYIRTYVHTYVHTKHMHVYVRMYVYTDVRMCYMSSGTFSGPFAGSEDDSW